MATSRVTHLRIERLPQRPHLPRVRRLYARENPMQLPLLAIAAGSWIVASFELAGLVMWG